MKPFIRGLSLRTFGVLVTPVALVVLLSSVHWLGAAEPESDPERDELTALADRLDPERFPSSVNRILGGGAPGMPELMFETCLADPRVETLSEQVQKMPSERRAHASRAIFDRKFADACQSYLKHQAEVRKRKLPLDEAIVEAQKREQEQGVASEALFLVSQFGSPMDLVNCIDRWEEFAAKHGRGYPEPLFILNLYLVALDEHFDVGTSEELLIQVMRPEVDRWIATDPSQYADVDRDAAARGLVKQMDHQRVAWRTHRDIDPVTLLPIPQKDAHIIKEFDIVRRWHFPGHTYDKRQAMLTDMRSRLLEAIEKQADGAGQKPAPASGR